MIGNRQRKAPPGQAGRARADTAGGQLTASTAILPQSKRVVKPESAGAVTILLRLNRPPEVRLTALTEQDEKALQPLAMAARRLAALVGVIP